MKFGRYVTVDSGNLCHVSVDLACRTGVMFCVYQGNRGESEASAKRELRAWGGSLKIPACPRLYHCSSSSAPRHTLNDQPITVLEKQW